jgi:hypothetical protein
MTCSRCGGEWCAVDEFDEQARGAFDDCAATQLEQMRRDLADLRARGVVPDADCTCGSGGHPRPCAKHPHRMEMHAREIDTENALEQMRRERDEARAHAEERTAKVRDLARCAAASEARARAYAAKLARIREVAECDYHDTPRTVLRIIDEKESGQ